MTTDTSSPRRKLRPAGSRAALIAAACLVSLWEMMTFAAFVLGVTNSHYIRSARWKRPPTIAPETHDAVSRAVVATPSATPVRLGVSAKRLRARLQDFGIRRMVYDRVPAGARHRAQGPARIGTAGAEPRALTQTVLGYALALIEYRRPIP